MRKLFGAIVAIALSTTIALPAIAEPTPSSTDSYCPEGTVEIGQTKDTYTCFVLTKSGVAIAVLSSPRAMITYAIKGDIKLINVLDRVTNEKAEYWQKQGVTITSFPLVRRHIDDVSQLLKDFRRYLESDEK